MMRILGEPGGLRLGRHSGACPRLSRDRGPGVSGASVSGPSVSGTSVSGASVSGTSVTGASVAG